MSSERRVAQGKHLLVALICLAAILAGAAQVFAEAGLSAPGHVALALGIAAAVLWISEAIPLFVTSLLVLLGCQVWLAPVLRASGAPPAADAFLAPFFSDTILLFLGGFALSAALSRARLDEALARAMLARAGSSPRRVVYALIGTTAFLSMWLSNTATAAMMLALAMPLARALPPESSWRIALVLAVPFGANVGGLGTPIGSPPNAIALEAMARLGDRPSFLEWMLVGVPGVAVMCAMIGWLLVRMYGKGAEELHLPVSSSAPSLRAPRALFVMLVAGATALGWMSGDLHGLSAGTIGLAATILLFGSRVLYVDDFRALPWDVLILLGGGLCLGRAVEASGLAAWLLELVPLENLGSFGAMVLFGVLAAALSSVMSNTAAANLVVAVVGGLGAFDRAPILMAVAFACTLAMPLPISTPPNAMAFGTGELRAADLVRVGAAATIGGLVLFFATGALWMKLLFALR